MFGDFEKLIKLVGDLKGDVKTAVNQLEAFNKTAPQLVSLLEKLNRMLEKGEPSLTRLVAVLEKMDENMSSLSKMFNMLGEE